MTLCKCRGDRIKTNFEPMQKLKDVYFVMYGARAVAMARENGFDVEEICSNLIGNKVCTTRKEFY